MKTVDKAMTVLAQFSVDNPEHGLSELARLSGLDKAATHRLLAALSTHGFVEQRADTRKYRLGYGFLHLARIREATVPLAKAAQEVSDALSEQCNETVHVSVPATLGMSTIAFRMPQRGNVINIVPTQVLPFHATSAGLAFMAFSSQETQQRLLELKRQRTTPFTAMSKTDVQKRMNDAVSHGFSRTRNDFEEGVASIAKPFYLDQVDPAGTISIAVPESRMTTDRRTELLPWLTEAISQLEQALTGAGCTGE